MSSEARQIIVDFYARLLRLAECDEAKALTKVAKTRTKLGIAEAELDRAKAYVITLRRHSKLGLEEYDASLAERAFSKKDS